MPSTSSKFAVKVANNLSPCRSKTCSSQGVADIYGWFTEGFDTADLKDAKALLEELSVK
jgi:hypothetical protein